MFGYSFQAFREKSLAINRSVNGLLIVTTSLDGFSLVNHRRFAKLSTNQTFLLYSMQFCSRTKLATYLFSVGGVMLILKH